MCTDSYVRYHHYKPPYKSTGNYYFGNVQKEICNCDCTRCYAQAGPLAAVSVQKEKSIEEKSHNLPALPCPSTTPETAGAHNIRETDRTANPATTAEPLILTDDPGLVQKDVRGEEPHVTVSSAGNRCVLEPGDTKLTAEIGQDASLPSPDEGPPREPVQHDTCVVPPERERAANRVIDVSDSNGRCGLLHFRKWWERNDVDISVFGTLISGIPIFIEENTLRVINDKYSYFVPLEKVDYIRTTDGLRSCFQSD